MTKKVHVIGAGIVGVCCASWLQRDGHDVTIIDRLEPGEATSFGNAGALSASAIMPSAMPGMLKKVPGWLLDPLGPLTIRWAYLPQLLPWLIRFIRAGETQRVLAITTAMRSLLAPIFEAYDPLLRNANATHLVRRDGCLYIYSSRAGLEAGRASMRIRRDFGYELLELSEAEVGQLEPEIARDFRHGVFEPDSGATIDPAALTKTLAEAFVAQGGKIVRANVDDIVVGPAGVTALSTSLGSLPVESLVIAAGAWSKRLAKRLGSNIPLETQRGYHATLPTPAIEVRHNIMAVSWNMMISPMSMGLRLAGTVELAGLEAPPRYERSSRLVDLGKQIFPRLETRQPSLWMGHRPCLPDSMPVIGRAPRAANAFFAFCHGHVGMCAAPVTGRIISDLVGGRPPEIDISPFRSTRFG